MNDRAVILFWGEDIGAGTPSGIPDSRTRQRFLVQFQKFDADEFPVNSGLSLSALKAGQAGLDADGRLRKRCREVLVRSLQQGGKVATLPNH